MMAGVISVTRSYNVPGKLHSPSIMLHCVYGLFTILVCVEGVTGETALLDGRVVLECTITPGTGTTWKNGDGVILYSIGSNGIINEAVEVTNNPARYANYGIINDSTTQFDLEIRSVIIADEGDLTCTDALLGTVFTDVTLSVNALPDPPVSIDCSPVTADECPTTATSSSSSEFMCTCTATGVYPETLTFEWKNVDNESVPTKTRDGELFNINATATVRPSEPRNDVKCFLSGYVNEEAKLSTDKENSKQFSSPTCSLKVPDITTETDCGNVQLRCDCQGFDGEPQYSFYNGDNQISGSPSSTETLAVNTTLYKDSPTYYCRVCNGIYYGVGSVGSKEIFCPPKTPPASTQDPEGEKPGATGGGPSIGLIIGVIVGVVVLILVVGIIVYFLKFKDGDDITATNGPDGVQEPLNKGSPKSKNKRAPPAEKDPEIPAYGVVNKPNKAPQPAPRGNSMELQYADLDHSKTPETNQVRLPQDEPTEYATVQSVVV